jgi:hypothetical protein
MRVKGSDGKWSAYSEFPVSSMVNFMAMLIAERIVSNKTGVQ